MDTLGAVNTGFIDPSPHYFIVEDFHTDTTLYVLYFVPTNFYLHKGLTGSGLERAKSAHNSRYPTGLAGVMLRQYAYAMLNGGKQVSACG